MSKSFEDAIRQVVALAEDADTLGDIVYRWQHSRSPLGNTRVDKGKGSFLSASRHERCDHGVLQEIEPSA